MSINHLGNSNLLASKIVPVNTLKSLLHLLQWNKGVFLSLGNLRLPFFLCRGVTEFPSQYGQIGSFAHRTFSKCVIHFNWVVNFFCMDKRLTLEEGITQILKAVLEVPEKEEASGV